MAHPGVVAVLAAGLAGMGGAAQAGAWPMAPRQGQVILKYEQATAVEGYDLDGSIAPIAERRDASVTAFAEYGLTSRLTAQAKGGWTAGEDLFVRYEGVAPAEIGLRWAVLKGPRTALSVYAGVASGGQGRNAGYAAPDQGEGDVELRVLAGRSGTWRRRHAFAEVQAARLWRAGLRDEYRLDTTLGVDVTRNWLVLFQTYAGQAGSVEEGSLWVNSEASLVRRLGDWRVQAGWRRTVAGRETPLGSGPVVAVWRGF